MNNSNYESNYNKIADYVRKSPAIYGIFKVIYKYIPLATMIIYGGLVLWCIWLACKNQSYETALKVILVPFTGVVAVSFMRKIFNFERPYTKYNIQPLMMREKQGESFPSRHTFSIGIIAMAFLYVNIPLGIFMLILTPILAVSRVIAGVHFIKDVLGAVIMAILWGIVGFYII